MKICVIRGCNLASLRGAFKLDLEAGALGRVALFAITGPTGAGKSTLLDALCLGLYDRIPRLRDAGSGRVVREGVDEHLTAKDVRSVLRHDAGHGFAEVEFVGVDGDRYRSRWSVHRAGKKASGKLQAQSMELENLSTGEQLAAKGRPKSQALAAIEARMGLSYDQFRRSVLLAQGDFAAFLKSNPSDRAALLEKMTGTEIYARLSQRAFERARAEAEVVKDLQRDLASKGTLSTADRATLDEAIVAAEAARSEAAKHLARVQAAELWGRRDRELTEAVERSQAVEKKAALEAAPPWAGDLKRALALEPLRPLRDAHQHATARQAEAQAQAKAADQALHAAAAARASAAARAQQARETLDQALAESQALAPVIDAALDLDSRLAEALAAEATRQKERERAHGTAAQHLEATRVARAALGRAVQDEAASIQALAELKPWDALRGMEADLARVNGPSGPDLAEVRKRMAEADTALQHHGADQLDADAVQLQAWTHLRAARRARARVAKGRETVTATTARLEQHEAVFQRTQAAAALDEHRAALVEGEPCPLCGALEHPRAGEAMRGLLAGLADELKQLRRDESRFRAHLAELEGQVELHTREAAALPDPGPEPEDLDAAAEALQRRRDAVRDARKTRRELDGQLTAALAAQEARQARARIGDRLSGDLAERFRSDPGSVARDAPGRLAALGQATLKREAAAAAKAELDREHVKRLGEAKQAEHTAQVEAKQAVEAAENVASLRAQRAAALPEPVAAARERLAKSTDAARRAHDGAVEALSKAAAEHAAKEAHRKSANVARDEAAERLAVAQQELARACEHHGVGLADLELAWDADQVRDRTLELQRLQEARVQAEAVLAERRAQRMEHRKTPCPAEADPAVRAEATEAAERTTRELARLQAQRERDVEAQSSSRALRTRLDAAERTSSHWGRLSAVIGAATGNRFRDFAQGLTLDRLLAHSNGQLKRLAPRYALRRVPGHNLEIQVEDSAQAGDVRGVASLSGGETFLVSLALALGLAAMSARTTKIESLFIDEGFGHLDQRSLELALATLDALQHEGRKVGVISHVQGLGDHIAVRVKVHQQAPGRSTLVVP